MKKRSLALTSALMTILVDTLSKNMAVLSLKDTGESDFAVIPGVFHFTYHENKGAAFGMLSDNRWVFMTISTVAIIAIAIYLFCNKENSYLLSVSLSFILGGGIGNMIDRVAFGFVVDFIDFRLIDFAVFNGADSFVCVGAGLLVLALILDIIRERRQRKSGDTDGK